MALPKSEKFICGQIWHILGMEGYVRNDFFLEDLSSNMCLSIHGCPFPLPLV